MDRRGLGRDLGLSLRMGLALLLVAAMYVLALLLSLAVLVSVIADRAWGALLGWFVFALGLAVVAVLHWLRAEDLVLRTVGARRLGRDEEPELRRLVAGSRRRPTCLRPRSPSFARGLRMLSLRG